MSYYTKTLGKILDRTVYAITGRQLHSSSPHAVEVFEALLDYHGLTVVSTLGLVVEGGIDDWESMKLVELDEDGIRPPKLKKPYSPELAIRLGTALIAAGRQAQKYRDAIG